jgi:hypothetical protein
MGMMYHDANDASEDSMTAVGVVLLAAAIVGIANEEALIRLTVYPKL